MPITIGRRELLAALGGAAIAWPLAARAQQVKLPTIGFLGPSTPSNWSQWTAAFVQRMRELGWTEGRTVAIEYRWAEGRRERYTEIAIEFVRLKVDVIVTGGSAVAARAAEQRDERAALHLRGHSITSSASAGSCRGDCRGPRRESVC
jgi:putative ABC transport system substrate-binding protein